MPDTVQMNDISSDSGRASPDRVGELDLLRFSAALMVVLFHYGFRGYAADNLSSMPYLAMKPVLKYGFLGVELFFMISGFVILMTASSGSLRKFAISRIVRLYPAYWACCTITFLTILALGGERFTATFSQYLINMTMLNEFIGVPSIDGVYWSLAVELKFYGLVAFILLIRQIHHAQWLLVAWLAATMVTMIFPVSWAIRWILIADYSTYFIAGATCYLIYSQGASLPRLLIFLAAWLLAIKSSIKYAPGLERQFKESFDPAVIALLVSSFFVLMLLVSLRKTFGMARKNWVVIGALTYPLYLLHQKIGYMIFNVAYPGINMHIVFWATVLFMLLLAYAIHRQVERRFARPFKQALERALDRQFWIGKARASR